MRYRYKFIHTSTIELKFLIKHPMSNFKGELHVIEEVNITKNGALIFRAHPTEYISKNPFFRLELADIQGQDHFEISWLDSLGNSESESFHIEVSA